MLHGMIPAAFFATLLRRYLDSLSETAEYTAPSSTFGSLGTTALVATVGMAAYGVSRLSRKNPEIPHMESDETTIPMTPTKKESCSRVRKRTPPRKSTRKRNRKNKKWFLKHMRHYKYKYGRQIGKLMNQFLGVPLAEPPAPEPVDLEESDYEDDVDLQPFDVFESPPYNGDTDERSAVVAGIDNGEDSAAPSRDRFEDDDDDDMDRIEVARRKSSSLDLKELLRENFELQRKSRCERGNSFESQLSISSSGSYKSGCSEDSVCHSRSSSKSKRSRLSDRISDSGEQQTKKKRRKRRQILTATTRKTRSGRCYSKSSP